MEESVLMEASMLAQAFGASADILTYSGGFSDSDWNSHLSGVYAGRLVDICYSGLFNAALDRGSYTSTGFVGSDAWSGTGSWSFNDVDSMTVSISFESTVKRQPLDQILTEYDRHIITLIWMIKPDLSNFTDFGSYEESINGAFLLDPETNLPKVKIERSLHSTPGFPVSDRWVFQYRTDTITLDGFENFDTGTGSGTIAMVPEPSSAILTCLGSLALLAYAWRRWKQGKKSGPE